MKRFLPLEPLATGEMTSKSAQIQLFKQFMAAETVSDVLEKYQNLTKSLSKFAPYQSRFLRLMEIFETQALNSNRKFCGSNERPWI